MLHHHHHHVLLNGMPLLPFGRYRSVLHIIRLSFGWQGCVDWKGCVVLRFRWIRQSWYDEQRSCTLGWIESCWVTTILLWLPYCWLHWFEEGHNIRTSFRLALVHTHFWIFVEVWVALIAHAVNKHDVLIHSMIYIARCTGSLGTLVTLLYLVAECILNLCPYISCFWGYRRTFCLPME